MTSHTAGISIDKEAAAGKWLTGTQQQSVIGALGEVTQAAGRVAPGIREAAAKANALQQAQVARGVAASRGAGVATGGGLAGASGTTALAGMKQAAAQSAAAEAAAGQAEVTAAQAGAEEATQTAAVQAESAAGIGIFVSEIGTFISEASQSGAKPAAVGLEVAGKLAALDITDPAQREAAIQGLGVWAAQRGYRPTLAQLARVVDAGGAQKVATAMGVEPGKGLSGVLPGDPTSQYGPTTGSLASES